MSAENPRYYKYYPQTKLSIGSMPFEGNWSASDKIIQMDEAGYQHISYYGRDSQTSAYGFGQLVRKKVAGRWVQVFETGVTLSAITLSATGEPAPVWFEYCGDGVSVVKLPNGEQPEPYEP